MTGRILLLFGGTREMYSPAPAAGAGLIAGSPRHPRGGPLPKGLLAGIVGGSASIRPGGKSGADGAAGMLTQRGGAW